MESIHDPKIIMHIVYDKKTGRIVHTHYDYSVENDAYIECDHQELIQQTAEDEFAMNFVTDKAADNLAVIVAKDIDGSKLPDTSNLLVDPRTKKLKVKPELVLSAGKSELTGDGKDNVEIDVSVVGPDGKTKKSYNGTIKLSPTRGKLSTKGGLVKIKNGKGKAVFTSVNETVGRVSVTALSPAGECQKANLDFEFV